MIVGMDFGTTNSGMAIYDGRRLQLIPFDTANPNNSIARTALYMTNDRQVYIGRNAIDTYYEQNLNRPVRIEKVWVGEITLTFAELPSFVRDVYIDKDVLSPGRLFVSFKTGLSSLNYIGTVIGSHFYFLEDIIALYLYIAKQRAENYLQTELKQIVLGRPVHFSLDPESDELARERLLKAAFRAGYEEVYLQYEPIAAAYHYESTIDREHHVLIFDFGGGTLDLSILRVGNPKNRAVLATGGVPIAGDIFDQKLVRAKLPKHFGEGSFYRAGRKTLSVPSSFYEAFSNWQDMLALQKPAFFEDIQRIEQNAEKPRQIRALKNLISSNYGLKMFDTVEAVKRQLSSVERTSIKLDGGTFQVHEPVTRSEFEKIIQAEIETIETLLDTVMRDAGLKPEQIDAVIRTGGSSEIPVFVQMLEKRFGREKVRSIDIFSSVTSGLGIIAHRVEQGEIDLKVHKREDYPFDDHVEEKSKSGVPVVDFEVMKKFIAFTEAQREDHPAVGLVALMKEDVTAALYQPEELQSEREISPLEKIGFASDAIEMALSRKSDEKVLLATSEYRFLLKTPQELATLKTMGLHLADAEGFHRDVFGNEHVTGICPWDGKQEARIGLLLTTSGYFKTFRWEGLITRIEQPVPYLIPRLKGDPVTLFGVKRGSAVIAFSAVGRAARMDGDAINDTEGRMLRLSTNDRVIAAFAVEPGEQFLLATADGTLTHLTAMDVPAVEGLGTTGAKVITRHNLQSVIPWRGDTPVWMLTSQRLVRMDVASLKEAAAKSSRALKFKKDETLISLFCLPD